MGIIGGTPAVRSAVIPLCLAVFLFGAASFLYSKCVEQGTIREGAAAVKRVIDEEINPKYADVRGVAWRGAARGCGVRGDAARPSPSPPSPFVSPKPARRCAA